MRVTVNDRVYKISFKHTSKFVEQGQMGRPKEILLPASAFGIGGRKKFRGMTECFISEVVQVVEEPASTPGIDFTAVSEGRALCDEFDQYRKEYGRQFSLMHALGIKWNEGPGARGWIFDETKQHPFDRPTCGAFLAAYFSRPRTRPVLLTEAQAARLAEEKVKFVLSAKEIENSTAIGSGE